MTPSELTKQVVFLHCFIVQNKTLTHKQLMVIVFLKLECCYFKCKHLNYSLLAVISNASKKCLEQCQIKNCESKPWIKPIHERLRIPGTPVSVHSGYSEHKKANGTVFSYHCVNVLLSFRGIVLTMGIKELTKPESIKALWWECLFWYLAQNYAPVPWIADGKLQLPQTVSETFIQLK